jgi:hypothetical protein
MKTSFRGLLPGKKVMADLPIKLKKKMRWSIMLKIRMDIIVLNIYQPEY